MMAIQLHVGYFPFALYFLLENTTYLSTIVCIHSTPLCDCNRIRMRVRVRVLQLSHRCNATLHSKHVFIDFHIFKAGIGRKLETPSASQSVIQSDRQTFSQSIYK